MDIGAIFWSAVSSTALVGLVIWLARNLIITRLTAAVRHEFDAKLARIQSEHRIAEVALQASLGEKQAQIESIRGAAISGLTNRQASVQIRRLVAIDQLWAAFNALAPARIATTLMTVINFETSLEEASKNERARQVFESLGPIDGKTLHTADAWKAQPFVSKSAWSFFAAYRAIVSISAMRLLQLQQGIAFNIAKDEVVIDLVKAALPHQTEFIDKQRLGGLPLLVEELEAGLLEEIEHMLSGHTETEEEIQQAAKVTKRADAVLKEFEKSEEGIQKSIVVAK